MWRKTKVMICFFNNFDEIYYGIFIVVNDELDDIDNGHECASCAFLYLEAVPLQPDGYKMFH